MLNNSTNQKVHLSTIAAISIVTWSLFAVLHEILGHAGAAFLLGEDVRGAVSTTVHIADFYNLNSVSNRIGWWGFRFVAAAGTLINLSTGLIALLLLKSKQITQTSTRYFLWLFASISIFQQGFWLTVMPFAALGGDWTAFFIELDHNKLWKIGVTIAGAFLLWFGYHMPLYRFWSRYKVSKTVSRSLKAQFSIVPILVAFITQLLSVMWSPLNGPRHTTIVSIFSFIPLILWLIPINLIQWPHSPSAMEMFQLKRSNSWILAGFVAFFLFVVLLGTGIGSFSGHPDY